MLRDLSNFIYWKLFAIYSQYSEQRLYYIIPNLKKIINEYSHQTESTGTKYPTLYKAVKNIIKYKPKILLESGTGTSTIVLAEILLKLKKEDPTYNPKLISMESLPRWYELAKKLLPKKYEDTVEIILGEREKFEFSMFRGYCHSNIPKYDYDFVFLDGPSYEDQYGDSCCLDALKVRLTSKSKKIVGVIDTRVSSVFVMQNIFGLKNLRYLNFKRTSEFQLGNISKKPTINSLSFQYSLLGDVKLKEDAMIDKR